jgi:hypothetical protein
MSEAGKLDINSDQNWAKILDILRSMTISFIIQGISSKYCIVQYVNISEINEHLKLILPKTKWRRSADPWQ